MNDPTEAADRKRVMLREALLLLGFVLLIAVGVVTVVLPELQREPDRQEAPAAAPAHKN